MPPEAPGGDTPPVVETPAAAPAAAPEQSLEQAIDAGIAAAKPTSEEPAAPAAASKPGETPPGEEKPEGGEPGKAPAKEGDEPPPGEPEKVKDDEKGEGGKKPEGDDKDKGAKPEGEQKKPDSAVEPDHVNDPIPAQVSERTRSRMTWLIDGVKQRDTIISQQRELMTEITSTGVSPENFGVTLEILRCFNSPNLDDKRKAYTAILGQAKALATILGEPIPGQDPLEGHADLQQEVDDKKITEQRAYEIAVSRNRAEAARRSTEDATRATQAYQQAQQTARADLNALGNRLAARDPSYAAKAPVVFAAIKDELATLHPSQWRARFLEEYTTTPVPSVAAPVTAPVVPAGGSGAAPLRPNKQPAGGGGPKAPASALEALEAGIEAAGAARQR